MQKLLTVNAASEQLAISPKTLWKWIYERRVDVIRLGRSVRISQQAITELIEAGTTPARVS